MKGVWFTEEQTPSLAISCLTRQVLHHEQTPYQELKILDTVPFDRMLVLDDVIQTTIVDEFVYHEMITLVGMNTIPHQADVLVIGGGDGGSVRELARHPRTRSITLVEIDERVIEASKKFLPEIGAAFDHPKVTISIGDGIVHVKTTKNKYDLIIVDSTDPVGPAAGLFTREFYAEVYTALSEDGLFVAQTGSPFFDRDFIRRVFQDVSSIFPVAKLFLANIPSYPGGLWVFTLGSKKYDPETVSESNFADLDTRYYSPQIHRNAFVLPKFVAELKS